MYGPTVSDMSTKPVLWEHFNTAIAFACKDVTPTAGVAQCTQLKVLEHYQYGSPLLGVAVKFETPTSSSRIAKWVSESIQDAIDPAKAGDQLAGYVWFNQKFTQLSATSGVACTNTTLGYSVITDPTGDIPHKDRTAAIAWLCTFIVVFIGLFVWIFFLSKHESNRQSQTTKTGLAAQDGSCS